MIQRGNIPAGRWYTWYQRTRYCMYIPLYCCNWSYIHRLRFIVKFFFGTQDPEQNVMKGRGSLNLNNLRQNNRWNRWSNWEWHSQFDSCRSQLNHRKSRSHPLRNYNLAGRHLLEYVLFPTKNNPNKRVLL